MSEFKTLPGDEFVKLREEFTRSIANAVIKNGLDSISTEVWAVMVTVENILRNLNAEPTTK